MSTLAPIHPKAMEATLRHLRQAVGRCAVKGSHVYPVGDAHEEIEAFCKSAARLRGPCWTFNDAWSAAIAALFDVSDDFQQLNKTAGSIDNPDKASEEFEEAVVARIKGLIESLPLTYVVTFPLPGVRLPDGCKLELGAGVVLLSQEQPSPTPRAPQSPTHIGQPPGRNVLANALLRISPPKPSAIQITCYGYASTSLVSFSHSALVAASSLAKKVLVGGLVTGVFQLDSAPYTLGRTPLGGWTISFYDTRHPEKLATCEASRTDGWHMQWKLGGSALEAQSLLGSGTPIENLTSRLRLTRNLLAQPSDSTSVSHISAAIEWFFEALQQSNQTLEFVQLCTAIEALLASESTGDKQDSYGVTAQLADRCAFLLGKNRDDREDIRKHVKALYKVRSKVIHGIATRLNRDDDQHLWKTRYYLERLLWNELQSLPDAGNGLASLFSIPPEAP